MADDVLSPSEEQDDHMSWVRTRMTLDADLMKWNRNRFALITVGFGSVALLDGISGVQGEDEGPGIESPSRIFSLVATAIGVLVIAIAPRRNRKMVEFVNDDAFGDSPAPPLPDEKRQENLVMGAIVIGIVSFIVLLLMG